jgi:hypothetical protein
MWHRIAAVVGAAVALVLTAAAVAVAFDARRWGCKSQAELERTRARDGVVQSFADAGVALVSKPLPRVVVGSDRHYEGAHAYAYATQRASLWVLVCPARCSDAPSGLDEHPVVEGRTVRQFSTLGNNIAVFASDNDRRSGQALEAQVQPVLNDLDVAEEYGSRCYIN